MRVLVAYLLRRQVYSFLYLLLINDKVLVGSLGALSLITVSYGSIQGRGQKSEIMGSKGLTNFCKEVTNQKLTKFSSLYLQFQLLVCFASC